MGQRQSWLFAAQVDAGAHVTAIKVERVERAIRSQCINGMTANHRWQGNWRLLLPTELHLAVGTDLDLLQTIGARDDNSRIDVGCATHRRLLAHGRRL